MIKSPCFILAMIGRSLPVLCGPAGMEVMGVAGIMAATVEAGIITIPAWAFITV